MLEQWLKEIDYSNLTAGIEEIKANNLSGKAVEIYNLSGQRVLAGNVDLQSLSNGIYLMSSNDGGKRTTKKLFINR